MKIWLILLIILHIPFTLSQSGRDITFVISTDNVPDTSSVYITGNHSLIGNWDTGKVSLTKKENNIWEREFSFPKGFHLEYKLTLGSWEQEALDEEGQVPANSSLVIVNDTSVIIDVNSWGDQSNRVVEGQITGKVMYHPKLKWEGIQDRDVVVWLPPGYDEHPNKRYPVLYMNDGQNMFDPQTSAFGVD